MLWNRLTAIVALALGVLIVGVGPPPGVAAAPAQVGPYDGDPRERVNGHGFVGEPDGRFETIDVPGATTTVVAGSDGRGRLVGYYVDRRQRIHGFVRDSRGRLRRIDFPGARGTAVSKAGARGQIVGSYSARRDRPAARFEHGFLLDGHGRFRRIDVRGATETRPAAINNRGQIVGDYVDRAGTRHAFLRDKDGTIATVDPPGAAVAVAADIDDQGRLVGSYAGADAAAHGFRRETDGAFTTIDFPDVAGNGDSYVYGINNKGQVAGAYRKPPDSVLHGFVSDGRGFATVDVPDAIGHTNISDIDDRGRLVGDYDHADRGYLRDERGRFSIFASPGAATFTLPYGINNKGEIVGNYDDAAGNVHGFLRKRHGRFTRIDVPGAKQTSATRINDRGQIVGIYSGTTTSAAAADARAFLLDRGGLTRIAVPGAVDTRLFGIDNHGRTVGSYIDAGGTIHGLLRDRRGELTTIDVPGAAATQLININDAGRMTGVYVGADGAIRAFVRDESGAITSIDPPGGTAPPGPGIATGATPFGIDNSGTVVGSYRDSTFDIYGFVLYRGRFVELRAPGALIESFATDIDDSGRIIGMIR
jgi:YD repeat-containing protein